MHPAIIRSIYWGYRVLHLAPVAAIALLPLGKWLTAIIAAVWPVWLIGVLLFETEVLGKWIGPIITGTQQALLREAEGGDAMAQFRLGRMYRRAEEGIHSTECDRDEAIRWYREAALQGHVEAAFALAECLMTESLHSVWPDETPPHPDDPIPQYRIQRMINGSMHGRVAAAHWYRVAAKKGHARAQGRFGEMCRTGNAVPKNRVAVYMWLSLALAGMEAESDGTEWPAPKRAQLPQDAEREEVLSDHHCFAAALTELEMTMTPAQVRLAKGRLARWKKAGK